MTIDLASIVIRGANEEKKFSLNNKTTLTFGSSFFCQVKLKGSEISRKHLKIYPQNGAFIAEALGKNYFKHNNQTRKAATLREGDVIELGVYEIIYYPINAVLEDEKEFSEDASFPAQQISHDTEPFQKLTQIKLHLERKNLITFERVKTLVEVTSEDQQVTILKDGF